MFRLSAAMLGDRKGAPPLTGSPDPFVMSADPALNAGAAVTLTKEETLAYSDEFNKALTWKEHHMADGHGYYQVGGDFVVPLRAGFAGQDREDLQLLVGKPREIELTVREQLTSKSVAEYQGQRTYLNYFHKFKDPKDEDAYLQWLSHKSFERIKPSWPRLGSTHAQTPMLRRV